MIIINKDELRLHRCCFTGHRPDKMKLGEKEIKPLLKKAIDEAIACGYVTFITGMAMGTDIWVAEIISVFNGQKAAPKTLLIMQ